jgi:hypothetical protein
VCGGCGRTASAPRPRWIDLSSDPGLPTPYRHLEVGVLPVEEKGPESSTLSQPALDPRHRLTDHRP